MIRNRTRNSIQSLTLFGVYALALCVVPACDKKEQPHPAQPVTSAKSIPKPVQKQVSTSTGPSVAPSNQFDFSTKKDPFKPFAVIKKVPVGKAERARENEKFALPIHSFDVGQFKLIGVITGSRISQAMVTDPNGKGYVLKVGMTIGKNDGRVMAITNNGVDVLEQFRDDNGRIRKEHIKLSLPRKL